MRPPRLRKRGPKGLLVLLWIEFCQNEQIRADSYCSLSGLGAKANLAHTIVEIPRGNDHVANEGQRQSSRERRLRHVRCNNEVGPFLGLDDQLCQAL